MSPTAAVERRQETETALQQLTRQTRQLFLSLVRLTGLSLALFPILALSFLTLDLPMRGFDGLAGSAFSLRASNWLSWGMFIMGLAPLAGILIARKFGGDEATRAISLAWGLVALAIFIELSYLAPVLEAGDMPPVRFILAFTLGAMAAQYVAVNLYDITRGGGRWWRAPLVGALGGYVIQALIYFPSIFLGAGAPWFSWGLSHIAIMGTGAVLFLGFYGGLRRRLRPRGGFGG